MEEWWGRTFEGRGRYGDGDRPDDRPETMRQTTTIALLGLVASEGERSVGGLAAQIELRRRESWTARMALGISVLALIVSALGAMLGR
jgi:ABC-type nitrate/sulfonate/bicarbonate transport system permease component